MEVNRICYIDIQSTVAAASVDAGNTCQQLQQQQHHLPNHQIGQKDRCLSPMTPSPRFDRNMGFFHMLSRRFGCRSHDDLIYNVEEDLRSSSTESCSSGGCVLPLQSTSSASVSNKDVRGSSMELSCASSETSSTVDENERTPPMKPPPIITTTTTTTQLTGRSKLRPHRRSTSSIRRAFENISISSRSLSCSSPTTRDGVSSPPSSTMTDKKNSSKRTPPQRILRQPISYTYLKGMSGLPTQRVPRSTVCCRNHTRW